MRLRYPNLTWAQIADHVRKMKKAWMISPEQAMRVYKEWMRNGAGELKELSQEVIQEVYSHVAGLRDLREMAMRVAEEARGGFVMRPDAETGEMQQVKVTPQPNVSLGAIARAAELRMAEITLLQSAKLLPNDLGTIEFQIDYELMVDAVLGVIEKFVPAKRRDDAELELLAALQPATALTRT